MMVCYILCRARMDITLIGIHRRLKYGIQTCEFYTHSIIQMTKYMSTLHNSNTLYVPILYITRTHIFIQRNTEIQFRNSLICAIAAAASFQMVNFT